MAEPASPSKRRTTSDAAAAQRARELQDALGSLQELTRALVRHGAGGVVRLLARRLSAGVALVDPEGRIQVAEGAEIDADRVRAVLERRPGQAQSLETDTGRLEVQPLGPRPRSPGGWLVIETADAGQSGADAGARLLVQHAVSLLTIALTRGDDFPGSPLGSSVLRTLFDQRPDVVSVLSGMGMDPRGRFVLLGVRADDPSDLARATGLARRTTPAVVGEVGATLVLVAADDAHALAQRMAATAAVVVSRPTDLAGLAIEAAGVVAAVRDADPESRAPVLLAEATVTGVAQPHLDRALDVTGRPWLARLRDHDELAGTELVATVTAYLHHHGRLDPAARDLGVHRHTVKHRLATAGQVAGLDLDDPVQRALLVLALPPTPPT